MIGDNELKWVEIVDNGAAGHTVKTPANWKHKDANGCQIQTTGRGDEI